MSRLVQSAGRRLAGILAALPVVLALFAAAPVSAQAGCDGLTYYLSQLYVAGGSYSIDSGTDVCFRFISRGADTYYTDILGGSLSPYTGSVTQPVNPGLPVALVTGADTVELWRGIIPAATSTPTPVTPTSTPSPTPEPDGSHCGVLHGVDDSLDDATNVSFISAPSVVDGYIVGDIVRFRINRHGWYPFGHVEIAANTWYTSLLSWPVETYDYVPLGTDFHMDFCFIPEGVAPTPTPAGTITPTATTAPTATPLPTPLPSQGVCTSYSGALSGEVYIKHVNGNFAGATLRVTSGSSSWPVFFEALLTSGLRQSASVSDNDFRGISGSTVWLEFSSEHSFSVQVCAGLVATVTPSPTRPPVFGTATATGTATPTVTPILAVTITPSALPPTPTLNPSCLATPAPLECTIIDLQLTQIAGPAVGAPTPAPTSAPNFSTAVAVICTKDPCASAGTVGGGVTRIIDKLKNNQTAPDCSNLTIPGFGTSGPWLLPQGGIGVGFCAFIEWTTPARTYLRLLSVLFAAFIAFAYFYRTMRRVGDV